MLFILTEKQFKSKDLKIIFVKKNIFYIKKNRQRSSKFNLHSMVNLKIDKQNLRIMELTDINGLIKNKFNLLFLFSALRSRNQKEKF
jgi:hypothetical protein